jgi:hypothetical protein
MTRRAFCFAGLLLVGQSPYSCHKPTLQENYADAKLCNSAYDAGLKLISADGFRKARLDPSLVGDAKNNSVGTAYMTGKQLGMGPNAIAQDLEGARRVYLAAHTGGPDAAQKLDALRRDVNDCLGDYYGQPND